MVDARGVRGLLVCGVLLVGACSSNLQRAEEASVEGDTSEAEQRYRETIAAGGEDAPEAEQKLAELLIDKGKAVGKQDPKAAEGIYREVLELQPESSKGRLGLARSLLKQDRQDEAMAMLDERRGCTGCGRLLAILLLERGEQRVAEQKYDEARADFEQSLELLPDPLAALGIVRTYAATNATSLAVEAMERALPLIKEQSTEAQRVFAELRRKLVLAAAQVGDIKTVDRYMAMSPPGAGGDEWFALQLDVARERFRRADRDFAIDRLSELLKLNGQDMAPSRRKEIEAFLVEMYSARAGQYLREGSVAKAENDLTYALRIDANNWTIKLQRVLAVVSLGKLDHSFRMLKKIPKGTSGRMEVLAILWSLRVNEKLAEGKIEEARVALLKAQKAYGDMPEVHVAAAQLLAVSPLEGLPKNAEREMKKRGLMRYPKGYLNRYGEALSEIDWARTQSEALGPRYPFRGPSTDDRMDSLERQIRSFYPFEVEFQAEGTAVLVLRSRSGARSVVVEGPGGFRQEVRIEDGSGAKVTIPQPGLTRIKVGKKTSALITEPYTQVAADL